MDSAHNLFWFAYPPLHDNWIHGHANDISINDTMSDGIKQLSVFHKQGGNLLQSTCPSILIWSVCGVLPTFVINYHQMMLH